MPLSAMEVHWKNTGLVKHNASQFPDVMFAHWEPVSSWEHLNRCVRESMCHTLPWWSISFFFSECMIHNQRLFMRERENRWHKRVILMYLLQIAQCTVFSNGQSKYTETLETQNQYLSQTATSQLHCASTCMKYYSAKHLFKKPWLGNTSKSLNSE